MSNIKNPRNNPLKNPAPVRPPGGSTAPKTVYVCSPFRPTAVSEADREAEQRSNIERGTQGLPHPRHDGHPTAGTTSVLHSFSQG